MEFKILKNGQRIPVIAFGTWLLNGQECIEATVAAIKNGYRLIDTAASYANEAEIGYAIQQCIFDGIIKREELFIITKLNHHVVNSYENTKMQIESSLSKLGLDYIDLYLIHYPNVTPDDRWKKINADSWRAMEEFYASGKIKYLGVSNFMIHHLEELFKTANVKPVVNQLELSPQWQQKELVKFSQENGMLCQAWSALLHGKISEKPCLKEIAQKYNKTIPQILLKWSIQKGFVPISKSKNIDRIKENIDVFDFNLDKKDIDTLNELNSHPVFHTTPDSVYTAWKQSESFCNKEVVYKEKFMLFSFLPLLTAKIKGNKKYWKLFNILTIIKTKEMNNNKIYIYLFGFIKIAKIQKKTYFDEKLKMIPKWD